MIRGEAVFIVGFVALMTGAALVADWGQFLDLVTTLAIGYAAAATIVFVLALVGWLASRVGKGVGT